MTQETIAKKNYQKLVEDLVVGIDKLRETQKHIILVNVSPEGHYKQYQAKGAELALVQVLAMIKNLKAKKD